MDIGLPAPQFSPDAGPYWDAAKEDRFVLQQCRDCKKHRFIPSHLCTSCGSDNTDWVEASGKGTIHSLSTVHRGPTPEFRAHTPYIVALIDLIEGPRMMTNLVGQDASDLKIGDAVQMCFEERQGGSKVPQFEKDQGASNA
jgi:uncharacterized OB-fold protein